MSTYADARERQTIMSTALARSGVRYHYGLLPQLTPPCRERLQQFVMEGKGADTEEGLSSLVACILWDKIHHDFVTDKSWMI